MKYCPTCKKEKSRTDFYNRGKKENNVEASWCKKCHNGYCIQRWIQKKIEAIKLLGSKCEDCNNEFHYSVYDFHHLYDKKYTWRRLCKLSDETIKKELKKCILLCSNCHRLRHYNSSSINSIG